MLKILLQQYPPKATNMVQRRERREVPIATNAPQQVFIR